ncbi:MAG TPA: HAMP domain-containing sensor histidine kinase, partial [Draconibacterium sp.]|nr:HAMP domain-containing sensor histidine kinase [Draconibacterium sp.]
TIGLYLYLAGIWESKEQRIYNRIIIGVPVVDFFQSLIFFFIFHSFRLQAIFHILFLSIYCFIAIYEMFHLSPGQKYLKLIFRFNAISFFIFLVMLLVNVVAVLFMSGYNPKTISESGVVLHIISGFVMIALTFGFLMAANMKLDRELRSQLKSKTKFFSIIAHDLRGPVGNIMSFMELLSNESDFTKQERREFIGTLNMLSRSTFHLLQNLLEWAAKSKNLNKYESEKLELNKIVTDNIDFFKSLAAIKSIQMEFNPGQQTYVSGNANMLETIIRNLISNAVKFTQQEGTITISTQKETDKVMLIVADTGIGIKPETLKSILHFEESKSTKGTSGEVGSGLGLVLCKEFAEQNNGILRIESQPGIGTTVTVEFPWSK